MRARAARRFRSHGSEPFGEGVGLRRWSPSSSRRATCPATTPGPPRPRPEYTPPRPQGSDPVHPQDPRSRCPSKEGIASTRVRRLACGWIAIGCGLAASLEFRLLLRARGAQRSAYALVLRIRAPGCACRSVSLHPPTVTHSSGPAPGQPS